MAWIKLFNDKKISLVWRTKDNVSQVSMSEGREK